MEKSKQNSHAKALAKPIDFMPESLQINLFGEEFTIFTSTKTGNYLILFYPRGAGAPHTDAETKESPQ